MKIASRKYLKLKTEGSFNFLGLCNDTKMLLEKKGFSQQNNGITNESRFYFSGHISGGHIQAFPALTLSTNLYFTLTAKIDASILKDGIAPKDSEIVFYEAQASNINSKIEVGEQTHTFKKAVTIPIRKSFYSFEAENAALGFSHTVEIRNDQAKTIAQETVFVQQSGGKKYIRFSFDFSPYLTGVYELTLKEIPTIKEKFIIDKNNELKSVNAVIKITYDNDLLKYNTKAPFDDDHFTVFEIPIK